MKRKSILLFSLLFWSPLLGVAQSEPLELQVTIHKIPKTLGTLRVALYNHKTEFLGDDRLAGKSVVAVGNSQQLTFSKLPPGDYGVAVFLDENTNEDLDTNFFGIPEEPYGFSNDAFSLTGPPSFEQARFNLSENKTIEINLR